MEYQLIDVSTFNTVTDWAAVKAAGIWGVMIRAGYGKLASQKDAKFESHYAGAKAAGLTVGAYWYAYAATPAEAQAEAEACQAALKGKRFELPIAYDLEDKALPTGKAPLSDIVETWGDAMVGAGYVPCVYASLSWLNNRLDYDRIKRFPIWLAQWADRATYAKPFDLWQYTDAGTVAGVTGKVDRDICTRDFPREIRALGRNGFPLPGDANGDGKVDTTDARLTLQYAARRIGDDKLDLTAADVNGDGQVDTTDARAILQRAAGRTAATSTSAAKSVEEVAREVIAGKWGNGEARKAALTAAGYDAAAVQKAVKEML